MSSIFIANNIPNGHSWTITSKLGHILKAAEDKYGPRDYTYFILGIEVNQDDNPRIWFPGNCNNIIIQITLNCINDLNRAVYQVSHEAIHCLSPTGNNSANVMEEGLATLFSFEYAQHNGHGRWIPNDPRYLNAMLLVQELIKIDGEIIKQLRIFEPTISAITTDLILKVNPDVPKELATALTIKF